MTLQRRGGAAAFSSSARAYDETMAPALRPVAEEVVRRARLRPGERVLDLGTGTGNALELAAGEGRRVIGVDAAPGMLDLARRRGLGAELVEADFAWLPLPDASVDVVLAVHALLFADDRIATLREWRRVAKAGARLSLSVPGPRDVVPISVLSPVYERHGLPWGDDYPTPADVAAWASEAGWTGIRTDTDAAIVIPLRDEAHFRTWLRVGARGRATAGWSRQRMDAFVRDLMDAAPRDGDGGFRLPFGAIYLTALCD
ncbi:MAG TPA: methyltransferase domain-containing protein [Candidatus Limnocylindria bacterium]